MKSCKVVLLFLLMLVFLSSYCEYTVYWTVLFTFICLFVYWTVLFTFVEKKVRFGVVLVLNKAKGKSGAELGREIWNISHLYHLI